MVETNSTEFHNESYILEPSSLLFPLKLSSHEFTRDWNRFANSFQVGAKALKETTLDILLDKFSKFNGFNALPVRIWDSNKFFFQQFSSCSWFKEQIFFNIQGELDPSEGVWLARIEFRGSSKDVLNIFRSVLSDWLRKNTENHMQVMDGM